MSARDLKAAFVLLQWAAENQSVAAYGCPSDPADAGRAAVREYPDVLRRLRDD